MSAPDASTTRQRATETSTDPDVQNPASLSANPNKKVTRNKPKVKPPFMDMSMNRFLTYLTLALFAVGAFYVWRFTVWAADAGGYWNLVTGRRAALNTRGGGITGNDQAIKNAASSAVSGAAGAASAVGSKGAKGKADVQSQIFALASALGVKPADLSAAIRPLIDPSVPNPAAAAQKEIELLKAQIAAGGVGSAAKEEEEKAAEGSLLGIMGEVLLD